jgi:uncharacterized membrane protein
MKQNGISWMMLGVALAVTLFAFPDLPDHMVVHWGMDGQPDGYASKWFASLMFPVFMLGMILLQQWLPTIDPNKENIERFQGAYNIIGAGIVSLFFILHLVVILQGLGYELNVPMLTTLLLGALFILTGNYLPRVRPNYFLGIRNPWTLTDEEVWRKTHRTGGKMFVAGGVLILLASFFPTAYLFYVVLAVVLIVAIGTTILSYVIYKQKQS